ncbi:unnamed protein product [Mytilus edulis]|uniref:Uncharacterized protein n=1 Tax=Mytilus edulis TaxID=6550 RepID=A0A8S3UA25_MYTED|nr:unnamed protein product [Mytilus edulis]
MYGYSSAHDYQLSPLSLPSVCMATPPHDYQSSLCHAASVSGYHLMTTSCLLCHCQVVRYGYPPHDYQLSPLSLPSVCMANHLHDYQLPPVYMRLLRMTTSCLLCHCLQYMVTPPYDYQLSPLSLPSVCMASSAGLPVALCHCLQYYVRAVPHHDYQLLSSVIAFSIYGYSSACTTTSCLLLSLPSVCMATPPHDYQLSPLSLPSVCMATPPHDYQSSPLSLPSVSMATPPHDYQLSPLSLPSVSMATPPHIAFEVSAGYQLSPLSLPSVCMVTPSA